MGTNYYVAPKPCSHCGNSPEPIHIGKSSAGWTFTFHAVEGISSFEDWKEYLADKIIVDEYWREISLQDFIQLVESKKGEKFNHAIETTRECVCDESFLDPEGHAFSPYEFS